MMPPMSPSSREAGRAMLRDERIGALAHECLSSILRTGRQISESAVANELAARLPARLAPIYRQSVRQRVTAALASYEQNFRRRDWRFVTDEAIVEDVALDLLWVRPDGLLVADEIKTGLNAALHWGAHERQCLAQLSAGRVKFGARFAGVRLLLLAEPSSQFFATWRGSENDAP